MVKTSELPDDPEILKALLQSATAQLAERDGQPELKDEIITRLEMLVADYKAALFGRKSEKCDPDQFELALEDLETAISAVQAENETLPTCGTPRTKRRTNRGKLPAHLPRLEVVIEPEETTCSCG